jgi:alpha-mannosidase
VDLSEGAYGAALVNNCKYGHDIRDQTIRLSLLRSPTSPDPEADQGAHQFAYRLVQHAQVSNLEIARAAYSLNDPIIALTGSGDASRSLEPLLRTDDHVILETVKRADDNDGLIVRLYECDRRRGWVSLQAGFPIRGAFQTNLLEENESALEVSGNSVRLYVTPFQIVTLRLQSE